MFYKIKLNSSNTNAVTQAQSMLSGLGYVLAIDGKFDKKTQAAVMAFQWENQLVVDGIIGEKTWKLLTLMGSHFLDQSSSRYLAESDLVAAAERLGVELAAIKAVNEVESAGTGFLNNHPKILFERHVFWKRLIKHGVDPALVTIGNEDILQTKSGGYEGGVSEVARLERASAIHATAALESASWGLFQIMGYHWKALGYDSAEVFMQRMKKNESEQLDAFIRYIEVNNLAKWLRLKPGQISLSLKNFAGFAYRYNGPAYKRYKYHTKMLSAYQKHSVTVTEELAILPQAA
ncbi:N-acetylmuramidase domain-containing protein [Leucothrix pacifica]|uniref:Peptidoglycan-binding protein n=1 Tax=Leucothrix pacifica TaxID=1247513 RepID=A0A317CKI7_9GAMM|nr:N-acetylmuramidase family protein [Leucothrix pacifica]PWQ99078.1 hypothetical protein DKW60_06460 [Leucothrix pacifica]